MGHAPMTRQALKSKLSEKNQSERKANPAEKSKRNKRENMEAKVVAAVAELSAKSRGTLVVRLLVEQVRWTRKQRERNPQSWMASRRLLLVRLFQSLRFPSVVRLSGGECNFAADPRERLGAS
jgi:hypothetical protein